MQKETALILSDGSLESAVLCAIARQKHDPVLVEVGEGGTAGRVAFAKQAEFLRPRQTHALAAEPPGALGASGYAGPDDPADLLRWTAVLAESASLVRQHEARAVYLPIRIGLDGVGFARAAEFLQLWEELLRHGLALGPVRLLSPLLELEPWQVADLSHQMNAPAVPAHGEDRHDAFVRAARAKP